MFRDRGLRRGPIHEVKDVLEPDCEDSKPIESFHIRDGGFFKEHIGCSSEVEKREYCINEYRVDQVEKDEDSLNHFEGSFFEEDLNELFLVPIEIDDQRISREVLLLLIGLDSPDETIFLFKNLLDLLIRHLIHVEFILHFVKFIVASNLFLFDVICENFGARCVNHVHQKEKKVKPTLAPDVGGSLVIIVVGRAVGLLSRRLLSICSKNEECCGSIFNPTGIPRR